MGYVYDKCTVIHVFYILDLLEQSKQYQASVLERDEF